MRPRSSRPFVVAEVLTAAPHPQADKLQVLTVDAGTGEAVQVVCGAPNARAGLKGVFGAPGAYVPGSDLTLKVAAIRGVESRGMMCSVRELELGDEHDGIIELAADAPVGAPYAAYAGLDDPVIDVAVTPNRQDAMGVHGIARDLAAAGLGTLKPRRGAGHRRRLPLPDRDPHRRSRRLPRFLRPGRPRRRQRPLAGLAAAAAEGGRPAADQRARRHDQLHHAELRPAAARLRPRQARRRDRRAAGGATARRCSRSTARPTGSIPR